MTLTWKKCLGFMDEVGWASDIRYKYYLYQTTTSFCNTTVIDVRPLGSTGGTPAGQWNLSELDSTD